MKAPDTPANEKQRLAALRALSILDTGPEERFDRLTRMAARVFDVPIAVVSLVDRERQWFKSRHGIDACETGRDISFCGHAILGNEIFVIEDALQDERFADNPLVAGPPHIRFYAGVPLRYPDGCKLGTLCIVDRRTRSLGHEDLEMLRDLANMAENELGAIQLATIDELTRISNRRGFTALARNSISLCARQHAPLALVYLDLDGFKPINDIFGHAEGDRALVAFAGLMRKAFRDSDVFARLGGDEFAVLLTNCDAAQAAASVARFRGLLEDFNTRLGRGYRIEFSDGIVSLLPAEDSTIDDLLREADVLMYAKKPASTRRAGGIDAARCSFAPRGGELDADPGAIGAEPERISPRFDGG